MGRIIEVNISWEGEDSFLDFVDLNNIEFFEYKDIFIPNEFDSILFDNRLIPQLQKEPGEYYKYLKNHNYSYINIFTWED